MKLLARLYDPDKGRILLDGHDLKGYDLVEVRANTGVIFQDFVRYHMTAAENIAVGSAQGTAAPCRTGDPITIGLSRPRSAVWLTE